MKRKLNAVGLAAACVALFTLGCSKEQTSMSVNDIQGRVKIVGSLSYNEGQTFENGQFKEVIKPAADTRVFIKVSNASLSPTSTANGYTTYEVVTDSEGKYEIEVPATEKREGTEIVVQPQSFIGKRTILESFDNGNPIFKTTDVVFSAPYQILNANPNDYKVLDVSYGFTERNIETGFMESVKYKVRVGQGVLKSSGPALNLGENVNILLTVTYGKIPGDNNTIYRTYGATTNRNGEAEFTIPATSKTWPNVRLNIKALPFADKDFSYYTYYGDTYERQPAVESGVWRQYGGRYAGTISDGADITVSFDEFGIESTDIIMVFVPDEGVETDYDYSDYDWSNLSFE